MNGVDRADQLRSTNPLKKGKKIHKFVDLLSWSIHSSSLLYLFLFNQSKKEIKEDRSQNFNYFSDIESGREEFEGVYELSDRSQDSDINEKSKFAIAQTNTRVLLYSKKSWVIMSGGRICVLDSFIINLQQKIFFALLN